MDSFQYTTSSSSSSSSTTTNSYTKFSAYSNNNDQPKKAYKAPPSYHSSLHSVRKPPASKILKKPIAPLPPTPPKIYKVESVNFREVVQKLTGPQAELPSRRLQDVAPPPLSLPAASAMSTAAFSDHNNNNNHSGLLAETVQLLPDTPSRTPTSATFRDLLNETLDTNNPRKFSGGLGALSPLAFCLSPASLAWCSSLLLSPGTAVSPFDRGTLQL